MAADATAGQRLDNQRHSKRKGTVYQIRWRVNGGPRRRRPSVPVERMRGGGCASPHLRGGHRRSWMPDDISHFRKRLRSRRIESQRTKRTSTPTAAASPGTEPKRMSCSSTASFSLRATWGSDHGDLTRTSTRAVAQPVAPSLSGDSRFSRRWIVEVERKPACQ